MASILTVGGTTVNRYTAHVVINRLSHNLDAPDCLEFTELCATMPGSYHPEQAVTLTVDGTLEFAGWIFSRSIGNLGTDCPWVGYRCLDLRFGASLVPITASDGTGTMRFNLPTTDDYYQSTQAGRSVGQILTQVFSQHSTALGAMGITTDATTSTQLGLLSVVPPEAIYFTGNALWEQCLQFLTQWYASKYALWITPGGLIRCTDTTTLSAATLNLDTDPVILDSITEDTTECFTQVCLRGSANIEPYTARLAAPMHTLIDPNDPTPENTWTVLDFRYPKAGFSKGAITAQTSTTITITSDSATENWPVNYWSGISAEVNVINPAITGVADYTGSDWRRVISNTALSAGGSSTITVDAPFATTGFTRYEIRGTPPGKSECYRRYNFKNRTVAQHIAPKFHHAVPWTPSEGTLEMTFYPQAEVISTPSLLSSVAAWPLNFEIVPYDGTTDGYIRFYEPTVDVVGGNGGPFGQPLVTGGSAVVKPTDIVVLVPYSRGALQAIQPMTAGPTPTPTYSGTAYTRFGIQRTLYREYPDWLDFRDLTSMQTLAGQILDTTSNVVQEGSCTYFGKLSAVLIGGSWPLALNLSKSSGTTGFETMAAPIREAVLEWPQAGATPWVTSIRFSTKRQQYSGDRLYVHPMYRQAEITMQAPMAVGAPVFGGMAGFGYEVAGTIAQPMFDPYAESQKGFAALGQQAQGYNPLAAAQRGFAGLGAEMQAANPFAQAMQAFAGVGMDLSGAPIRTPTAAQARTMMEGPAPQRSWTDVSQRLPQGMRGVTTTAAEREATASRRGIEQTEERRRIALQEQERSAAMFGGGGMGSDGDLAGGG